MSMFEDNYKKNERIEVIESFIKKNMCTYLDFLFEYSVLCLISSLFSTSRPLAFSLSQSIYLSLFLSLFLCFSLSLDHTFDSNHEQPTTHSEFIAVYFITFIIVFYSSLIFLLAIQQKYHPSRPQCEVSLEIDIFHSYFCQKNFFETFFFSSTNKMQRKNSIDYRTSV